MNKTGLFTVAAIARQLGLAPATLRTWDRRYGLGPQAHEAGLHRRYSHEDVARLQIMRRLVMSGMAPAQAAQVALATTDFDQSATEAAESVVSTNRETLIKSLYESALSLDNTFVRQTLRQVMDKEGAIATWESTIVPLLQRIGKLWELESTGIAVEHSLSATLIQLFSERAQVSDPVNARPVLLASAPEEQHTLPLYALAAALAEVRVESILLGARTPSEALGSVMRRNGALAVFVWAQSEKCASMFNFDDLPSLRPAPRVLTGGPGFAAISHSKGAEHVTSLVRAYDLMRGSLGI